MIIGVYSAFFFFRILLCFFVKLRADFVPFFRRDADAGENVGAGMTARRGRSPRENEMI